MENAVKSLWKAYDLLLPLVNTDITTYLVKEGFYTEDDVKVWNEAKRHIVSAYKLVFTKGKFKDEVEKAIGALDNLKPKKPLPPEMKERMDSLISSLKESIARNDS
ncbi:hypothetical protein HS7_00100 [Sulfolobales archaeon HS-7]|nr:hypothetical protein HS7_00100 [Sulfolobales archaeon HS-7]